jgi:RNA polymerase sigma-70 factor (ECF subfamily)
MISLNQVVSESADNMSSIADADEPADAGPAPPVDERVDPEHRRALDLLASHGDALYRFALLRLRSSHSAEDVVQETLLAALANSGDSGFEGRSSVRTWLIGIARRKVSDHQRRLARESPVLDGSSSSPDEQMFDKRGRWTRKPASWRRLRNADPHALLEQAELRNALVHCLESIPRRLARLFMLREADGMKTSQICQNLNLSESNVWTLLSRARLRLRLCLGAHGWDASRGPRRRPS